MSTIEKKQPRLGLSATEAARTVRKILWRREYRTLPQYASLARIWQRCAQGCLQPFHCSACGHLSLDVLGWNGPNQPLCERCADPEEPPAEVLARSRGIDSLTLGTTAERELRFWLHGQRLGPSKKAIASQEAK
jgi:hypothetical protein